MLLAMKIYELLFTACKCLDAGTARRHRHVAGSHGMTPRDDGDDELSKRQAWYPSLFTRKFPEVDLTLIQR